MPGDAKDTGKLSLNGSTTLPTWALLAILGGSLGGGVVPNIMRGDDGRAIEQLSEKVEQLATKDDLRSLSASFAEMARQHGAAMVDLGALKERVRSMETRIDNLEGRRTR